MHGFNSVPFTGYVIITSFFADVPISTSDAYSMYDCLSIVNDQGSTVSSSLMVIQVIQPYITLTIVQRPTSEIPAVNLRTLLKQTAVSDWQLNVLSQK